VPNIVYYILTYQTGLFGILILSVRRRLKGYTQFRESCCSGSDGSISTVPYRGA